MISSSLERVKNGDLEAFSALYDFSYNRVYASIFHRTLDVSLTEDIVSEVYMKALKNLKTLKAQSEWEFITWMLRIAYTHLVDTMRARKDESSLDDMTHDPGYELSHAEDIDNKNSLEEVLSFMETLPERDRMILTLRIWDDCSYEEISVITGEKVDNCKKIVSRTLAKISANVAHMFIISLILSYVSHR